MEDRKQLLAKVEPFVGLGDRELGEIAALTRKRYVEPRHLLCRKGDESGDVFIVVSGRLRAYAIGAEGREIVFRHQGPGELSGELGAFEGKRTANVEAMDASELLVISRRDFMDVLRRFPDVAIRLLRIEVERVTRLTELMEDTNLRRVDQRLAKCLLGLAKHWGQPCASGLRISVRLPQAELGDLIAASRESVNKAIRGWMDAGVLEMNDGMILIKQPEQLEQLG